MWDEVVVDLSLEGVRPITPDQQSLETICKISEDTARTVIEEQTSILQRQETENISKEELMYTEVRESSVRPYIVFL